MKFLLDTHVLLWWAEDHPRLSDTVRAALSEAENELYFSAASGWEIAIKAGLGKLEIEGNPKHFLFRQLAMNDINELSVTISHAAHVFNLPMHHKDPFDRLLIAQAQLEGLTILSNDAKLRLYQVAVRW